MSSGLSVLIESVHETIASSSLNSKVREEFLAVLVKADAEDNNVIFLGKLQY
ncbi:hypothetical protein SG34_005045 [Thalassomonas viridans]|uniref:Uncharacterized protein n=1 Tax=Thalassomonas viridans TaxID=137584 RepID=A0AAE9Z588_9GAMM|nr:hypothetical protein [Thalassomonas viridans]WDE06294.1 hypothetical protein SG34_005045 [Thalassomonas viridans]